MAFRQAAPKKIIKTIEPLYKKLIEIEKADGMDVSVEYLLNYIDKHGTDYNGYIEKLEKRSTISLYFLNKAKKLFS